MRILYSFVGSVCCGKTTISRLLASKFDIQLFSIDDYRIKHNAYMIDGEWEAYDNFIADAKICDIAMIESSGLSKSLEQIYKQFDRVIVIKLSCSLDVIEQRLTARKTNGYVRVPYYKNKENHISTLKLKMLQKSKNDIPCDYHYDTSSTSIDSVINDLSAKLFE